MKVVILAGGRGTRLAEETETKPKPLVEIGGYPILWHIMKHYASYGFNEFVIAVGYRGIEIKRYFLEYPRLNADLTIHLGSGKATLHEKVAEDWIVHLIDTGLQTHTGGRIKRLRSILEGKPFLVTYGDGVSDLNLKALLAFHQVSGKTATVTAVRPPARFGGIRLNGKFTAQFTEKPQAGEGWINGGFFVFNPEVLHSIQGDHTGLEFDVLESLSQQGQLAAYRHEGFWQCMDTLRDKQLLEELWKEGKAPWKVWK